jgi:methylglutaconyl-CoA hydratase
MAGVRKPCREMAADGAGAENANPHCSAIPVFMPDRVAASFHGLGGLCNIHATCNAEPTERDGSIPTGPAYWPAQQSKNAQGVSFMSANPVLWSLDAHGVATVTLNRPEVNNAYDAGLIGGVLAAMDDLGTKPQLRVVVLKGNGRHFQAGADLKWINAVRPGSVEENEAVSRATFEAVQRLNTLPIPTVALVQGGCFGGGTGIISACDVVIAADNAMFSITEVRWGLTAAIIIPQLCDAIGVRQVRRYALTGERFGAQEARRIGLVHEVVPLAELESAGDKVVEQLLANGPEALAETKRLAMESSFGGMSVDHEAYARLVRLHSAKRRTKEASEGLASFAEKRGAKWGA